MRGDLLRGRDKRLAIRFGESTVGPVIAVVIAFHRAGPVFVQRQVEALDRHALARQVGEGRAIQERAKPAVPGRPVENQAAAVPRRGTALCYDAVLVIGNPVQDRPVPVG